jgi:polyisoprenoid-binding protein YceI
LGGSDLDKSHIETSIDATSIDTRDAQRALLCGVLTFWKVEKFPPLSFRFERISIVRDGELAVEGDRAIHGFTRKVVFTLEGPTPPTKDPCPKSSPIRSKLNRTTDE